MLMAMELMMPIAELSRTGQSGLTLIELLISMLLGVVLLAAASSVLLTNLATSSASVTSSRLNEELMTLMSVMVQDIRRAGYSGDAGIVTDPTQNDLNIVGETALAIQPSIADPDSDDATLGSCILYTYDANGDGLLDDQDIVGFRLDDDRGVVQMRQQGDVAANTEHDTCDNADDTWLDLTDGNLIRVTALTFNSAASACLNAREPDGVDNDGNGTIDNDEEADCYDLPLPTDESGDITVETREILVSLEGGLANDPDVRVAVEQSVRVRNDLVRVR
jgi:prepilin peptidase dependent protein B